MLDFLPTPLRIFLKYEILMNYILLKTKGLLTFKKLEKNFFDSYQKRLL